MSHMSISNFYMGSRLLEPISLFISVSLDQVNFFACMLTSMILGLFLQLKLSKSTFSSEIRYLFSFIFGNLLCLFCFGYQVAHLNFLSLVCYALLQSQYFPLRISRVIVLLISLAYLSGCHIARQYHDYGAYTLDITGPVMILVQRLSTLAYNLYDGQCLANGQKLQNPRHIRHAVKEMPSFLHFMSYAINFQTVMVGPLLFYTDYACYIEGQEDKMFCHTEEEKKKFLQRKSEFLLNKNIFYIHLFSAALHGCAFKLISPHFPSDYYLTPEFKSRSIAYKVVYLMTTSQLLRQQYYFAWTLASLCCLCSGFGFSGFRQDGKPVYENVKNFDWYGIEFGSSFKIMTDSWNMTTTYWLRECIYDRLSRKLATPVTFLVSAIWHGFYPNYYTFFFTGALLTQAWRVGRRCIRPFIFPNNDENSTHPPFIRNAYHTLTVLLSIYSLNYAAVPFVMLHFWHGVTFWNSYYWFGHIASVLTILFLPKIFRPFRHQRKTTPPPSPCHAKSSDD